MSNRSWATVAAGVLLSLQLPGAAAAAPVKKQPAAPVVHQKSQVLLHLKELDNKKLTPVQKAKLGLRLYRAEMVAPTPRPTAKAGQPVTDVRSHDWVLAKITQKLADANADTAYLKAAWARLKPGEVKDSLTAFLALKGQEAAREPVAALVSDPTRALWLREAAARGLGSLAVKREDPTAGAVLARAIREDGAYVYRAAPQEAGGYVLVFPVRRAAVEAVRKMEKAGLLLESFVTRAAQEAQVELPVPQRAKTPQRGT